MGVFDENPEWFEDIEPDEAQEITADEMLGNNFPEPKEVPTPVDIDDIPDLPDMSGTPSKMCKVTEFVYETHKAWRLTIEYNDNQVTDWFPKSKCSYNQQGEVVTIPLWLINKKNWD